MISRWVVGYLHGYGLDEDDSLNAGEIQECLEGAIYDFAQQLRQEVEGVRIKVCGCSPFQSNHDGPCSSPDTGWEQHNEALRKVLALIDTKLNENKPQDDR